MASTSAQRVCLVTGGAGFIGSHLVEHLVARGDRVVVVDDLSTGRRSNLAAVDETRMTFIEGTVSEALPRLDPSGFDEVYHLAAAVGVSLWLVLGSLETTRAAITTNVILMRCLPMPAPSFGYQVATFSKTPGFDIEIAASTVDGEGADCAVAISQILALQGMSVYRMNLHAGENALIEACRRRRCRILPLVGWAASVPAKSGVGPGPEPWWERGREREIANR